VTATAHPRAIDHSPHPDRIVHTMRALGKSGLPESFSLDGKIYRLAKSVKHDFVAATGFYRDESGAPVVLKIGRTQDFAGFPLLWLGKALCRRETRFYRKLQDLPNVPRLLGYVGQTGFVHEYVRGSPLSKDRPLPDGFFAQLQTLLEELHRRNIAYVDTNKPENILHGEDGLPHLIDFQISLDLEALGDWPLGRWLLRRIQAEDFYHFLKHKRRFREDQLTAEEKHRVENRSALIRLHRLLTRPYFQFRRRTFKRLRAAGRLLPEGSK
jgi:hypothetical protein